MLSGSSSQTWFGWWRPKTVLIATCTGRRALQVAGGQGCHCLSYSDGTQQSQILELSAHRQQCPGQEARRWSGRTIAKALAVLRLWLNISCPFWSDEKWALIIKDVCGYVYIFISSEIICVCLSISLSMYILIFQWFGSQGHVGFFGTKYLIIWGLVWPLQHSPPWQGRTIPLC